MLASETTKNWNKGYVSGSFDLFHIGHLNLIRRAKERCDWLIAGVLTDELVFGRKKKWPVMPLDQRMEIIAAIRFVDEVVVTTPDIIPRHEACKKLGFDAFFTGDDWKPENGIGADELALNALGADLVFFPYTKGQTTTLLQELTLPLPAESADKPRRIDEFRYVFPFDKVKKGERVAIYGKGVVGQQYLNQLQALNFCHIAAVVDSDSAGELAKSDKYDKIVVASTKYHEEIVLRLRALGIPTEKIV